MSIESQPATVQCAGERLPAYDRRHDASDATSVRRSLFIHNRRTSHTLLAFMAASCSIVVRSGYTTASAEGSMSSPFFTRLPRELRDQVSTDFISMMLYVP
jgi:hypothetical protein